MSVSNLTVTGRYTADGTEDSFAIPFQFIPDEGSDQIKVYTVDPEDETGAKTLKSEGALADYVLDPVYDPNLNPGGPTQVIFNTAPADGLVVLVTRELDLEQLASFVDTGRFPAKSSEKALDRLLMMIQQLAEQYKYVLKIPEVTDIVTTRMQLPLPGTILAVSEDGTEINFVTLASLASEGGLGVPPGGETADILEKQSDDDGDAIWGKYEQEGFSARYGESVSLANLRAQLAYIFDITYTAPLITLSGSSNVVREKGDTVASVTLTAAITKQSDPIAEVRFYLQPSTLLDTQNAGGGIPDGGNSQYVYNTPFADTTQFRAEVDDNGDTGGPTTVVSSTLTYTFVYPYYVGAGAAALAAASVAALTKLVQVSTATVNRTITAGAGEVFYFAYPASYGALTSILDVNNFETLPDWTQRTENITGLDGNPVSYYIYEFDNPVTAGDYFYSFRR